MERSLMLSDRSTIFIFHQMKGKKNDYAATFFNNDEKVLHLGFVHDTKKAAQWVNNEGITWTHGNIYDRRTREFVTRIYPDNIK